MRVRLAACAALVLILGACTAGGAATPPGSPPAVSVASPPASAAVSAPASPITSAVASPAPTAATSWGPILDRVPASFPRYPGAADANGATSDPVTQSISTSASVSTVSGWYTTALAPLGYKQTSISNPAEDGSVVAEFDGGSLASGCRAQLTYRPMGALTFIFVLVGAACPSA